MRLVDAHAHCYEFSKEELSSFVGSGIVLVCVSDDAESALKTLELASELGGVTPCLGFHPWNVGKADARRALRLMEERGGEVKCLGEVGLDKQFVPETFESQLEVFRRVVDIAREYGLALNVHSPRAWREAFEELLRRDVDRAYFHWYTGPLDLMEEIEGAGYYVGVNAALTIQAKHRQVAEAVRLDRALTESDGPYEYRGLKLRPPMVRDALEFLSRAKGLPVEAVAEAVLQNYARLFK